MLRQPGGLPERFRRVHIIWVCIGVPAAGFQQIDLIRSLDDVRKAPTERLAQLPLFMLHVQRDDRLSCFQEVEQEQLHQIRFPLTGVAENEDIGAGFVFVALVEIDNNVAAVFVFPDVKAFSVRFTGIVEWEQICDRACWQDALILCAKHIESDRADRAEACLLPELQLVHVQLRAHELDFHVRLQNLQFLHISRNHFDVDGAMEQRFLVPVQGANEVRHVLQIALCFHRPLHILGAAAVHPVADLGVMDDFAFFERRDHACIDVQRHAVLFAQMPQDGKIVGRCWILAQRPNAAERVAADVVSLRMNSTCWG